MADSRGPMRENSSQSQTRLSASNRAELLASYAEGVPVRELAAKFNIHRATVREIARRAGHASRQPELSDRKRAEAARLYENGLTLAQVAEQLGISDEGVRAAVVSSGGTIRPRAAAEFSPDPRSVRKPQPDRHHATSGSSNKRVDASGVQELLSK